jgi:UDP-glucose 4-epimerase
VGGIMLGIERSSAQKNIFNLGHDYFITVVEVANIVLEELELKGVRLEFAGGNRGWLGDSPFVHLETSKLKALGWKPRTPIAEGIRRTVRYLRQNPKVLEERG